MSHAANDTCPICTKSDWRDFKLGSTALRECRSCTVTVNALLPENSELDAYYRQSYVLKRADESVALLTAERRRYSRFPEQVSLIADIQKHIPSPANVLDVGCDRGFFLDEIRRHGYSVRGVELSESARAACDAIGISVTGTLGEVPEKWADCVTLWHVLEHIPQPLDFLSVVRTRMTDHGTLMVRVPDFSTLWRSILGSRWIWFQPQNHYVHYTARSLRLLLENAGFSVISCVSRRANTLLTHRAYRVARRTFKKSMGLKTPLRTQRWQNI